MLLVAVFAVGAVSATEDIAINENNESILENPNFSDVDDIKINEPVLQDNLEDNQINDENIKLSSVSDESIGSEDASEYIVNPSFENGTDGWDTDFSRASTAAHSGSYGLQTTQANRYMSQTLNFNSIDSISFWVSSAAKKVNFNVLVDEEVVATIVNDADVGNGIWKQFTVDTSSFTDERLFKIVNNERGQLRIDDFTVNTNKPTPKQKMNTIISVDYADSGFIVISLKDEKGYSIPNVNLTYNIDNGETTTVCTDNDGRVTFCSLTGNFSISANFTENDDYLTSNKTVNFYNITFTNNPFINPNFEDGNLDVSEDVYGWNVTGGSAHGGDRQDGMIKIFNGTRALLLSGNYYGYFVSQYINFDYIDKIIFKYYALDQSLHWLNYNITTLIGDNIVENSHTSEDSQWQIATIDTKDYNGINLFAISVHFHEENTQKIYALYLDDFAVIYDDVAISNFTYTSDFDGENVTVNFINTAIGLIDNILWDFGDNTTSNLIHSTHIFKPGTYNVTLTVNNGEKTNSQSYLLAFDYPSIDGKMYASVQEAINNAESGAVIDIPVDVAENLIINQTVTLNFNGNELNAPLINVVGGADVIVNNITLSGDSNVFAVDETSKLTIKDSTIDDAKLELQSGNINVEDIALNNSYLTITNANAEINHCNINASEVIVNGGKSKILNTEFTNCDAAVTQNNGELNLTSNLFTANKVAVNVTNGTGNINFNAIYGNTEFGIVYKGNINIDNNWFGKDEISYINGNETPTEYADVYQAEETSSDVVNLMLTITSPELMIANKEYDIVFDLTMNSMGQNTSDMGSLKTVSLDVASSAGDVETLYLVDGVGVVKILVGDSDSEGIDYTILGQTYSTESAVVSTPKINITVTVEESTANIVVNIPHATGNVSLIVDKDKYEKVLDGENTLSQTIDNLIAGTHNIVVIYHGDNIFDNAIQTDSFDVDKSTKDLINELKNQTEQIGNLTDELADANGKVDDLTSQLNETQANASKLADELDVANGKVDDLTSQLNETQANATKLADELANAKDNITDLSGKVDNLTADLDAKDSVIDNLTKQVDNLTDVVNVQNSTIANQAEQISALNNTIAEKDGVIASKDAEISNLNDTVNTQSSTIDSQKALINNLNETIIEQNNKVSNPIATSISVKDITTTATTAKYFTISLVDANNNPLVNKTIKYTVNGKTGSATTNGSGIATVKVSYSTAGTRYYTFSFLGDEKDSASIATAKVVVNKKATKITAPKKTFKVKTKTKKVQVKLTSGKTVLKNKKVTLKVKGKTYIAKTNKKGIATFKIIKLTKKGNFKYTVKFAGDKAYKAINKNGKIIVK